MAFWLITWFFSPPLSQVTWEGAEHTWSVLDCRAQMCKVTHRVLLFWHQPCSVPAPLPTSCRVLVVSWWAESVSPGSVGGGEQKRIIVAALEGRKCPRSLAWHKPWAKLCFSCALPTTSKVSLSLTRTKLMWSVYRSVLYLWGRAAFFSAPIPCKKLLGKQEKMQSCIFSSAYSMQKITWKAESSGKHPLPSLTVAVKETQVCYESC